MSHPLFVLPSDAGGWTTSNTVQTPFVDSSKPPVYEQAVHPGPSAPQPVVAQMSAEQQNAFALFMQQQQQPAAAKNTPLLFGQQPVAPQALVQLQPPVVQQQICQSQYQQPQATTYAAASPLPQLPVQASSFAVPAPRAAPAQQVASSGVDDGLYSRDAILSGYNKSVRCHLAKEGGSTCPAPLSERGVRPAAYARITHQAAKIKSRSDTNKVLLHVTGALFIGWWFNLMVAKHWVGNKPLHRKLAEFLEHENAELGSKGIPVRFVWHQGSLMGYYN